MEDLMVTDAHTELSFDIYCEHTARLIYSGLAH